MRKQLTALVALAAMGLSCGSAIAQETATAEMTGKEVLTKHVEAVGGAENMKKAKTTKSTGKFSMPAAGIEAPMTVLSAAPNSISFSMEIPGIGSIIKGTDGNIAWEVSAMGGPRILEGSEKEQFMREADPLADLHPDKYFKSIECLGKEKVGDRDCYKVEFTTKSDKKETRYFDAETFLVAKSEQITESPMGEINVSSIPSDYKEISGMKIPHKVEIDMMGQTQVMTVESVEINAEVPDGTFDIPEEIKELQTAEAS